MTRTPFDAFSKQFLEEFLSPLGSVETSREVPGETRWIDVWFEPTAQLVTDPSSLGLLGKLAATACLIEPFRNQPSVIEVQNCKQKLFSMFAELQRQAERENRSIPDSLIGFPRLWILASSASEKLLNRFRATPDSDWATGVYFSCEADRTGFIAINQLPITPETLWVRLLGKGKTQEKAIAEILALDPDDSRRLSVLQLLVGWKISLEVSGVVEQEDDLMTALSQAYLEWEQRTEQRALDQGIQQGIQQGVQAERRAIITNILQVRFGCVDESLEAIIPALLMVPAEESMPLLLQLSREELLARFQEAEG